MDKGIEYGYLNVLKPAWGHANRTNIKGKPISEYHTISNMKKIS